MVFLEANKVIKGWLNDGRGSNTRAEFMGLQSGLYVERIWGVKDLYVAGESQVIIHWALEKGQVCSLGLFHWLNDTRRLIDELNCCSFSHIFHELNMDVNALPKT